MARISRQAGRRQRHGAAETASAYSPGEHAHCLSPPLLPAAAGVGLGMQHLAGVACFFISAGAPLLAQPLAGDARRLRCAPQLCGDDAHGDWAGERRSSSRDGRRA